MSTHKTLHVTTTVRDRIRDGEYRPGARIPSQSEMAKEFGVSGRTIAQVIADLRKHAYLWTLPHKGSYARPREHWQEPEVEMSDR